MDSSACQSVHLHSNSISLLIHPVYPISFGQPVRKKWGMGGGGGWYGGEEGRKMRTDKEVVKGMAEEEHEEGG